MGFETTELSGANIVPAPDGSDVRLLCALDRGSMAHFELASGQVSRAVMHRTVEELWFFVAGRGRMWRAKDGVEETVVVRPGIALSIPTGTAFQFRSDDGEPLAAIGVTMPPWPGDGEAVPCHGVWDATV
jgi:mannose-6-phosphate isomerase-like protein (cupin superfamily)